MGTQYEIWNKDSNEYITAQSIGWDSKQNINCTGSFSKLLMFLLYTKWNGDRIEIVGIENWDYEDQQSFKENNKDITQEALEKFMLEFKEDLHGETIRK